MENSGTVRLQRSAKSKITYIIKESLRPRSKEEYARVLGCDGVARRVPWLYHRVLAAGFLLFCVTVLAYCLDRGAVSFMTAAVFGALMVNIPVLVFFYELNPFRDISLLTLVLTAVVGGALACAVITFGYEYIYSGEFDSPWISLLWTGFWEELVKAAVAISAVFILKKNSPLACFLVGFAVGTGYSVLEDLGYIYAYSRSPSTSVTWVVLMSLGRSLSCGVSHAPWTGIILWAFAKFKRPFLNFRFYGAVAASMVLHYFADVPFFADEVAFLTGLNWGWLIEAAVVIAILALVYLAWRDSFKDLPAQFTVSERGEELSASCKLSHAGNLAAVFCAVVFGAFTLAGCAQITGYTNEYATFGDSESLVNYAQKDCDFEYDWGRAYDPETDDYSRYMFEGTAVGAVQKVVSGKHVYFYAYTFSEEGALLESIGVQIADRIYYCAVLLVFEDFSMFDRREPTLFDPVPPPPVVGDGDESNEDETEKDEEEPPVLLEKVQFFLVNGLRADYDAEAKQYTVLTGVKQTDNTAAYIAFGALAGATALGGATAVAVLKIKSRRKTDE